MYTWSNLIVFVVVVVVVVVVGRTTLCSGGNPVLRKISALVNMSLRGLFSIACVCSNSIVVFAVVVVAVVVIVVDITALCSGGNPVLCDILCSRIAVVCPPVL